MSDEDKTCSICLEGNTDMITECKHNFHTTCLNRWLIIRDICPSCTRQIRNIQRNGIHDFKEGILEMHEGFVELMRDLHGDFKEDIHDDNEDDDNSDEEDMHDIFNQIGDNIRDIQEDIQDAQDIIRDIQGDIRNFREGVHNFRDNFNDIQERRHEERDLVILQTLLFIMTLCCLSIIIFLPMYPYLNNVINSLGLFLNKGVDKKEMLIAVRNVLDQISKSRGNFTLSIPNGTFFNLVVENHV